ncbi:hypothetical protein [Microbacterium sp. cx-59]|uniref:hypothetical protein n=1 Tax=Microbacterium sp. cx-59 TaxID=2891207 RepID=UPI001E534EEA|nr:hypothetical protein [Microbacterium sp. cx-59]MCC4906974.1 hypothetical protein [Microbacterium sp. cx-59]
MPTKPAGARAPQDRQPKTEKPKVESVEIDLPDGFDDDGDPKFRKVPASRVVVREIEVTVPKEALDDFELLDDIRATQDEHDMSRFPSLLRRLVGDDAYRSILDALRGPNGRVSASDGAEFVFDVFKALNPNS